MSAAAGCRVLDWDTQFFGFRIGRIASLTPTAEALTAALAWAAQEAMAGLYLLVDAGAAESMRAAEAHGFRCMDLRLTYRRRLGDDAMAAPLIPGGVRAATKHDLDALRAITAGAFRHTRFSRDPRLAPRADALYATWIERAVDGLADAVLVSVGPEDEPTGFVCCHVRDDGQGEIGLTAVREDQRGRGIGGQLVAAASAWLGGRGMRQAVVVTNAANLAAQRLYQRHGYFSDRIELWYHRWASDAVTGGDRASNGFGCRS